MEVYRPYFYTSWIWPRNLLDPRYPLESPDGVAWLISSLSNTGYKKVMISMGFISSRYENLFFKFDSSYSHQMMLLWQTNNFERPPGPKFLFYSNVWTISLSGPHRSLSDNCCHRTDLDEENQGPLRPGSRFSPYCWPSVTRNFDYTLGLDLIGSYLAATYWTQVILLSAVPNCSNSELPENFITPSILSGSA